MVKFPLRIYYFFRPLLPRIFLLKLRQFIIDKKKDLYAGSWPIDKAAGDAPPAWTGWPDNKRFVLVLTHDVETAKGQQKCYDLVRIEKELGFRSSFNFVPERYQVCKTLRYFLKDNGFEIGVHGLKHDGRLYRSKSLFQHRAVLINSYLKKWKAVGFRSPAMHHNLSWLHALNIEYDSSTFDTDPFEPQPDGVGTIFPFWVNCRTGCNGYVEMPYTLPQDFTLFILMKEKSNTLWEQKLYWIFKRGGMALLNTHPDYMCFNRKKTKYDQYPADFYANFLEWIRHKFEGKFWHVLPKDLARFWKQTYRYGIKHKSVSCLYD